MVTIEIDTHMSSTTFDTKELWNNCLTEIEQELSRANFSTWFKNTYILKEEGGIVHIAVPNEFVKDWLSHKYHKLIFTTLEKFFDTIRGIEYVVTKQAPQEQTQEKQQSSKKQAPQPTQELPLHNLYVNKEDNLNPRYVFDNFIVGSFNELAYAAAQAIINKPGVAYNPFFVYGGTGLGKTHLIQAVGNALKHGPEQKKIYYTTLEKFSIDYINSLQKNKPNAFKEKYRQYDVLIMDDIQFISNKEKTQEELFHLFNTLYESNKQIIFSSDKHVNYIPGLEDRLKSRFAAGMIVDIVEPEYESRLAILRSKVEDAGIDLPQETIEYLAANIEGNIRELEGSLNTVVCQSQLKDKELSLAEIKKLTKDNAQPKKKISITEVVKAVSNFYNIEEQSIYEKTRRKEIVRARQLVMYILREDFSVSYPHIGKKLGGKDHTTVIHSCSKIKNALKEDTTLAQEIEQIRVMFR